MHTTEYQTKARLTPQEFEKNFYFMPGFSTARAARKADFMQLF